jgi:hypothetical protein
MNAPAIFIDSIARETIRRDGRHGTQIGQRRPQAIEGRHMGGLELASARGPKPLPRIVEIPHIEVTDLRSLEGDDAKHMTRRHLPGACRADRNDHGVRQAAAIDIVGDAAVEGLVHLQRGAFGRLIGGGKVLHADTLLGAAGHVTVTRSADASCRPPTPAPRRARPGKASPRRSCGRRTVRRAAARLWRDQPSSPAPGAR